MNDFRFYPVVIVASGPSLTTEQTEYVRAKRAANQCRVIVINNCYRLVPNADILYASDFSWWKTHFKPRVIEDGQPGILEVCPNIDRYSPEAGCIKPFGTQLARIVMGRGIAPVDSPDVRRGSGSGFQATGLAIKFGARKVVLVGMDCKRGRDGKSHWHGDHPKHLGQDQPFNTWADEFDSLAGPAAQRGLDIVNCSLDSAIRLLRRGKLEEEI